MLKFKPASRRQVQKQKQNSETLDCEIQAGGMWEERVVLNAKPPQRGKLTAGGALILLRC